MPPAPSSLVSPLESPSADGISIKVRIYTKPSLTRQFTRWHRSIVIGIGDKMASCSLFDGAQRRRRDYPRGSVAHQMADQVSSTRPSVQNTAWAIGSSEELWAAIAS